MKFYVALTVTAITAPFVPKADHLARGGTSMIEAKVKLTFPETTQFMAQTGSGHQIIIDKPESNTGPNLLSCWRLLWPAVRPLT
jgi:hypothetical protein